MFDKLEVNQGMLVENIVAQMLKAAGHNLFFFSNSSRTSAEDRMGIDFLIAKQAITSRTVYYIQALIRTLCSISIISHIYLYLNHFNTFNSINGILLSTCDTDYIPNFYLSDFSVYSNYSTPFNNYPYF